MLSKTFEVNPARISFLCKMFSLSTAHEASPLESEWIIKMISCVQQEYSKSDANKMRVVKLQVQIFHAFCNLPHACVQKHERVFYDSGSLEQSSVSQTLRYVDDKKTHTQQSPRAAI
jgi:hypothetical protein